jgi:hypothetical protein
MDIDERTLQRYFKDQSSRFSPRWLHKDVWRAIGGELGIKFTSRTPKENMIRAIFNSDKKFAEQTKLALLNGFFNKVDIPGEVQSVMEGVRRGDFTVLPEEIEREEKKQTEGSELIERLPSIGTHAEQEAEQEREFKETVERIGLSEKKEDEPEHEFTTILGRLMAPVKKKVSEKIQEGAERGLESVGIAAKGKARELGGMIGREAERVIGGDIPSEAREAGIQRGIDMVDQIVDSSVENLRGIARTGLPAIDRENEEKQREQKIGIEQVRQRMDANNDGDIQNREIQEAKLDTILLSRAGQVGALLGEKLSSSQKIKREKIPLVDTRRGINQVPLVQRAIGEYKRDRDEFSVEFK